jgi:molybdopterin/thiamine biosynthesis adenylyltransferase
MLSGRDRQLYARHLLLTEIGETGQERLCARRVALPADADAEAGRIALDYLVRAGVSTAQDADALDVPNADGVSRMAGDASLTQAASVLAGAFAAVEAIKASVGAGRPATLPRELLLSEEPS